MLTGQAVKLPLTSIANVLNEAHNEKYQKEWHERLHDYVAKKIRRDVLALLNGDVVNGLQGAVGDADAEGKTIEMALASPARTAARASSRKPSSRNGCTAISSSARPIRRPRPSSASCRTATRTW